MPLIAVINKDRCVGCGLCEKQCQVGAIKVIEGKARVDIFKCLGCGSCRNFCRQNAIQLKFRSPVIESLMFKGR